MADSPADSSDDRDSERAAVLTGVLDRLVGARCAACSGPICGHEVLFSVALGLKDAPRCLACLARGMQRSPGELRDQLLEYARHRDCYRQAWDTAGKREGVADRLHPACLWGKAESSSAPCPLATPEAAEVHEGEIPLACLWDAGDMGCGELVLALRVHLLELPPRSVLKVTARDPAAPEDLPAWCRLTGHRLVRVSHPYYFIQRKEL